MGNSVLAELLRKLKALDAKTTIKWESSVEAKIEGFILIFKDQLSVAMKTKCIFELFNFDHIIILTSNINF